jgi:hypothetical protein
MIWPRFVSMQDLGSQLRFTLQQADGSLSEALVWKRIKLHQPDQYNQDVLGAIIDRHFDLARSRALVFDMGGGLGDFVIAFQAVLALREFLAMNSTADFEFVGRLAGDSLGFFGRFLDRVPVFDSILRSDDVSASARHPGATVLDAQPYLFRAGDLTVGTVWDHLWWKWALPGRYTPAQEAGARLRPLRQDAPAELRALRRFKPSLPEHGQYVVLADDAVMLRNKKAWPAGHWRRLVDWVLRETPLHLVVMTTAERARAYPDDPRLFIYDYRELGAAGATPDLLRLCAVIDGARAVVSVESGVAHVAGLLDRPCITLWGPTRPVTHGQPGNINLRLSSCPPCCSDAFRQATCRRYVCMEEIAPAAVIKVLADLLRDPQDARRLHGALVRGN